MSYYTTGTSFSLKTGTPLPRVIYNNNGITSSRTSGVIAPTDPQTNGPASTSVFMELAIDSKGTVDAEQLAREFVDKIEPQIAVGFVLNGKVYDCYVFLTTDTWTNYKSAKIERRAKTPNNINYEEDRASGTTSFMSSDGSKKWCIIDDQLYYNNTDNVNNFVLVSKSDDFISYGTCSPDGSIVYLIKKDGSLQTMAIP